MADIEVRSVDPASQQMIVLASEAGIKTVWDRLSAKGAVQIRAGWGYVAGTASWGHAGSIPTAKGASREFAGPAWIRLSRRNLLRHIAAGGRRTPTTAARSSRIADGGQCTSEAYKIRGPASCPGLAEEYGIAMRRPLSDQEVGKELAKLLLAEFVKQDGTLINLRRARAATKELGRGQHAPAASIAKLSAGCT